MIRRSSIKKVLSSFHRIIASGQLLAISALALGLSACYNEPNVLGGDLIPSGDKTAVQMDTSFQVAAYTIRTDTIPTNTYTHAVLGCYNSTIFGKIKADFRSRIVSNIIDTVLYKITPRPTAKSLTLKMRLSRTWGIEKMPINIKVYELSDSLSSTFFYNGLGAPRERFNSTLISLPTIYNGGDSLKIQLTDEFANKLINASDSALTDNKVFIKYVKGLYVTSDDYSGQNGVMYFFDYNMRLDLKYNYTKNGEERDTVFIFYTSPYTTRYNHFEHNYETASVGMKINHLNNTQLNDTIVQDSLFYISGLGGTRGIVKFKSLKKWMQKMPIAINRAELRFDIQELPEPSSVKNDSSSFPLYYYFKRDNDTTAGYSSTSMDIFGLYDYSRTNINTAKYLKPKKYYSLDVTQHLQNTLRGKVKRDYFFLEPTDFKSNYKEGIFRSGNNSKPIKLIITYSKL